MKRNGRSKDKIGAHDFAWKIIFLFDKSDITVDWFIETDKNYLTEESIRDDFYELARWYMEERVTKKAQKDLTWFHVYAAGCMKEPWEVELNGHIFKHEPNVRKEDGHIHEMEIQSERKIFESKVASVISFSEFKKK